MEKKLKELKSKMQDAFKGTDIIVDDVTFSEKGKYHFLTAVLDRVGGIDLETIVDATETVNKVVDNENITDDSYILDVISKERGNN